MTDPITRYVDQVAHHLTVHGPARRKALDDLATALAENAAEVGIDRAVSRFGPAADYAAELDADLGTPHHSPTVLGVPNSLGPGIRERMAATFDPGDPHLIVPHVFGIGWALNLGAVVARLGLLNPDDLDEEILTSAADGPGRWARVGAYAAGAAALGVAAVTWRARGREGAAGRRRWADPLGAAAGGLTGLALAAQAEDGRLPARQRLVLPAFGVLAGVIGISGPRRQTRLGRLAGVGGLAAWAAATYLPVRQALRGAQADSAEVRRDGDVAGRGQ